MPRVSALGLLALALVCNTAGAQGKPRSGPAAERTAPIAKSDDEVARGLFQAGKAAYDAGNYAEALTFFEQAHARSGRPELLYNIGQAAERLRHDEKALEMFRAYLAQVPGAGNRAEVETRIKQLEAWIATHGREPEPVAPLAIAPTPAETAARGTTSTDDPAYTESDRDDDGEAVTETWWFWTGIGAVVVGGTAVALAVALGGDDGEQAPLYEGNGGSLRGP